jgi:hypothetical protein
MNWYGCLFLCRDVDGGIMDFLSQLLRGIAFVPALVNGIENLFGTRSGLEKKEAAMSFLETALGTIDAIEQRNIIDPEKFKQGISEVVDGVVICLNASSWAKPTAGGSSDK